MRPALNAEGVSRVTVRAIDRAVWHAFKLECLRQNRELGDVLNQLLTIYCDHMQRRRQGEK